MINNYKKRQKREKNDFGKSIQKKKNLNTLHKKRGVPSPHSFSFFFRIRKSINI